MSIINKLFSGNAKVTEIVAPKVKPQFRFNSALQTLGAQVRPTDTRTPEQLKATIEALADRNPSVKEFVDDLLKMNPKHLGLAADTMELASKTEMSMTNVNMNKPSQETGKSLLQYLLSVFPKASKENPHAMEFAQEVINNTDALTSKYFLALLNGIFTTPQAGEHLKAMKPLVKPFAEATINGGYLGTWEKQQNFVKLIKGLLTPQAKPEKIALIPKLCDAVDRVPEGNYNIVLNKFANSEAPVARVEENIEILPEVLKNVKGDSRNIDVVDFVNNNVNLI